jgi:hypothetical protein
MRLRLLITILAMTLLASAHAEGNRTLVCSTSSSAAGCWVEAPVWASGDFEIALGVDSLVAWAEGKSSYLAPYVIAAYYGSTWSVWGEFAIPETRIPHLGKPDPWRVGVRVRF